MPCRPSPCLHRARREPLHRQICRWKQNSPPSPQAETDDGPWPSIARHGRHRICRRYDNNGENTPGHPSPRLHTMKWELADALDRPDMAYVPMAGHGPSPDASRRLRGRDTDTCRRRRQLMCLILPRSTCNSPEYSDYTPLRGRYRHIVQRGTAIPPSEGLNMANE